MMGFLSIQTFVLCLVIPYATGKYATGNAEEYVVSEGEDNDVSGNNVGGATIGDPEEFNENCVDEGAFTSDATPTPVREKHKLNRTPNSKRRRKSNTFDVSDTCKTIQEMIKLRTAQSTSGFVTSQASLPVDPYSIGAVVAVLNGMPDLEQNLYNKAVNQACVNATWREAFIITLLERRRELLESL